MVTVWCDHHTSTLWAKLKANIISFLSLHWVTLRTKQAFPLNADNTICVIQSAQMLSFETIRNGRRWQQQTFCKCRITAPQIPCACNGPVQKVDGKAAQITHRTCFYMTFSCQNQRLHIAEASIQCWTWFWMHPSSCGASAMLSQREDSPKFPYALGQGLQVPRLTCKQKISLNCLHFKMMLRDFSLHAGPGISVFIQTYNLVWILLQFWTYRSGMDLQHWMLIILFLFAPRIKQ